MSDEPDGTEESEIPTPRPASAWTKSPKKQYLDQLIAEDYDSMGEGARREMLED
ncbi:hypothetical protein HRK28_17145 [Rathayibacter sp. VKM Ac-2835]|uniref:hypothetical protein n=1 Tax=Rathayibacter sp. VKM Ac-2835 TaxID=2739043 RepID=UPI001567AC10|nr:hypothetical protein [Rathayibacter sp. VKM Ac-2835]NRG42642.1 hypothetical protein [Rathayibacter sp. VKM Ac-2835]